MSSIDFTSDDPKDALSWSVNQLQQLRFTIHANGTTSFLGEYQSENLKTKLQDEFVAQIQSRKNGWILSPWPMGGWLFVGDPVLIHFRMDSINDNIVGSMMPMSSMAKDIQRGGLVVWFAICMLVGMRFFNQLKTPSVVEKPKTEAATDPNDTLEPKTQPVENINEDDDFVVPEATDHKQVEDKDAMRNRWIIRED